MTIRDRVRCRGSAIEIYGGKKKETLRGIWLQRPLRMQPQGLCIAVDGGVQKACRHGLLVWESKGNHHIHEGRLEGKSSVTGLPLSRFLESTPTSAPSTRSSLLLPSAILAAR